MTVLDSSDVADVDSLGEAPVVSAVKAKALHTVLSDALNFTAPASVAKELPMLAAVRLEAGGGHLVAAATDRFVLGVSRVDYVGESFTIMVAAEDAKVLARIAKTPLKRDESWREATVTVGAGQVRFRFNSGEDVAVRGMDVDFPKWRQMVPSTDERMGGIVGMGYRPALLAKFTKVRPEDQARGERLVVFPSTTSQGRPGPTAVTIGEDFIGLLMPYRAPGDKERYVRPGWFDEQASDPTEVRAS